ncbi:DUF3617 domain-containing protein [Phenylobacterium montanum]|uniref:DUF3617 family protein n=1 Tax=Phenylobacterium montanum TaxID=2823693 RepID=A0A975G381_9CAUL|nr:DUF3617 family protein [Caulobacter sp. S6]QUD90313.1 DUF3617 family protein [Caulobacter sp. S6]
MIRFRLLALMLAPVLGLAAPALAENTILPGYWESRNHSELLISQDSTDRKCITPAQVEAYLTGPTNRHYSCTYDHRAVGGGSVNLAGQCVDKNGLRMSVGISGTYTPESFHLKAKLHTIFASLPIDGAASIDAHRVSADCPMAKP